MEKLIAEETPHETTAHRGDCVFYHHRIVHSAGVNRTGFTSNPWIRKAALCDFMRADRPMKAELPLEMSSYRKVAERAAAGDHPSTSPPLDLRSSLSFSVSRLTAQPCMGCRQGARDGLLEAVDDAHEGVCGGLAPEGRHVGGLEHLAS